MSQKSYVPLFWGPRTILIKKLLKDQVETTVSRVFQCLTQPLKVISGLERLSKFWAAKAALESSDQKFYAFKKWEEKLEMRARASEGDKRLISRTQLKCVLVGKGVKARRGQATSAPMGIFLVVHNGYWSETHILPAIEESHKKTNTYYAHFLAAAVY